ncbi:putative virulence protein [Streptomyces venezuelae]|nr:putative virulence protein [Streptomyces venezuelae]
MNKITGRVTDRHRDFCAQTADRLVRKYALVVLEDLRIKNMSASASGSLAEPGRQVRQKAGLNRAILDKGWHRLELALTSAARYTGTSVVKVNPAYTSQRCSACGFVTEGNRESQAVFVCKAPDCGHREHADVNAGKNIKAAGLAVSACGDLGAGRSVKQEPVGRVTGRTPHQGIPALQGGEDVKGTVIPWPPPRP